jgi:hypothetical protein
MKMLYLFSIFCDIFIALFLYSVCDMRTLAHAQDAFFLFVCLFVFVVVFCLKVFVINLGYICALCCLLFALFDIYK